MPVHPHLEILIELRFSSEKTCRSIIDAIIPDNVKIPKGVSLQVNRKNATGFIAVSSKSNKGGSTLSNTIDELLEHVSLADNVMRQND